MPRNTRRANPKRRTSGRTSGRTPRIIACRNGGGKRNQRTKRRMRGVIRTPNKRGKKNATRRVHSRRVHWKWRGIGGSTDGPIPAVNGGYTGLFTTLRATNAQ